MIDKLLLEIILELQDFMVIISVMDNHFLITASLKRIAEKIILRIALEMRNNTELGLKVLLAANYKLFLEYNLGICNLLTSLK